MANTKWHREPDVWALIVASVALAVSVLSWLDVSRQLELYRGQVRAYVQVTDVRLIEPITKASFIKLKLSLKNSGQTAAVDIVGEMDYRVGIPERKGGNDATRKPVAPMGPGLERTFVLSSNRINRFDWPKPHARQNSVYFFGTVWYRDDTTKEQRKEDFCYELPLRDDSSLQATTLEPCGILQYTSNAQPPS